MKRFTTVLLAVGMMIATSTIILTSCTKEGPQGPPGTNGTNGANGNDGTNGANGKDANETCKLCHAATVVDSVAVEYELAKHAYGTAAFEEAGNTSCAPCHEHLGFLYVCKNNTPASFTFNSGTGKYVNDYASVSSDAIGEISCFTCHSSLHTTYGYSDISSLTTTAPVPLTMWGGAKTINLAQKGGEGNLCAKCHQPRPLTCNADPSGSGRLLSYDTLLNYPLNVEYDSATGAVNKYVRPAYRMHIHYGVVSGVYAGVGAIEYPGTLAYTNSPHTTVATCQDCHMAPKYGVAGGHAFNVRNSKETGLSSSTTWNFNGCNVADCHQTSPISASSAKWSATRAGVKTLLDNLAAKINAAGGGHDILHKDSDGTTNLWAGITTNNYDGYLDIYSSSSNPLGYWRDPYNTSAANMAKPKFPKLLMVQMGAIINFQFCLREYSLGIHNTQYVTALMTNTIAALP